MKDAITYEQYWNAVLGDRSAEQVIFEFDLVNDSTLDGWLGECEADAVSEATDGWPSLEMLSPHHERALAELRKGFDAD